MSWHQTLTLVHARLAVEPSWDKKAKAPKKVWWEPGEADMNDAEVLFHSLAICVSGGRVKDYESWVTKVLAHEADAEALKSAWKPPTDDVSKPMGKISSIYLPLVNVYKKVSWLGRGRTFKAYRQEHHASSLFMPFARALGSRQDLDFDGAVPVFVNREICTRRRSYSMRI